MLRGKLLGVFMALGLLMPAALRAQEDTEATYWIGINMLEISDAIRHHLPDDVNGVLVGEVLPDLPAAQAGIQRHDIIVSANGQEVDKPAVIVEAVSKGEEVSFGLLRKGEEFDLKVTPVERDTELPRRMPSDRVLRWFQPEAGHGVPEQYRQFFGNDEIDIEVFRPGVVIDRDASGIPNGVRIEIERKNDEPARIRVSKGDESWSVTEEEIDEIPDKELRSTVRGMVDGARFRGGGAGIRGRVMGIMPEVLRRDGDVEIRRRTIRESRPSADDSIRDSIQEIQKQLEELTRRFDKLSEEQ